MNYLLTLYRYKLSIVFFVSVVIIVCSVSSNNMYADNTQKLEEARALLAVKLESLEQLEDDKILLNNMALDDILKSFSGIRFTFAELDFEFLLLSQKLRKTIVVTDASAVFNNYKENAGQKYTQFDTIEYHGDENFILRTFTPNAEDGQYHVEEINGVEIRQKPELLITVSSVKDRAVKVKTGIIKSDKVFINSGISFKYRGSDERVDSKSILGFLPVNEKILVLEGDLKGDLNGGKLEKGVFVQILGKKYGGVEKMGDYIK
ncbi:MAG: hypothetical protein ACUZ8E_13855 [Candidatus Anammoxibacter sp.]